MYPALLYSESTVRLKQKRLNKCNPLTNVTIHYLHYNEGKEKLYEEKNK
jgi:hypothetical protein